MKREDQAFIFIVFVVCIIVGGALVLMTSRYKNVARYCTDRGMVIYHDKFCAAPDGRVFAVDWSKL